jgi:DNA (cytosine-5)-methyltransferase 1
MADNSLGSLFSGIGGLDLGLERAGWESRWQIEWNPFCLAVLAEHFPNAQRYSDIARLNLSRLEPVRLMAGGFPCQPHSFAGKRKGINDGRWLWPFFASAIETLSPQIVFIENVLGLRTSGMRTVLADLAYLGFDAEWSNFGAIDVGAPHRRQRIFIVAHSNANRQRWDDMADTESLRRQWDLPTESPRQSRRMPKGRGANVADTHSKGSQGWSIHTKRSNQFIVGPRCVDDLKRQWEIEPDVGRVVNGIPDRVDRLTALGNAVVPQVAEWIARNKISQILNDYPEPSNQPRRQRKAFAR